MKIKTIDNPYFKNFCDVIERSLTGQTSFSDCLSDMISASEDIDNKAFVYTDTNYNMETIKLDEYTKDFNIMRRLEIPELKEDHKPAAVDAVCVNKNNKWFLIEFKNKPLKKAIKSTPQKMLSSFWLIAFLYSRISKKIADESDILKFARNNVTFITVVSSEKNADLEETIGATWEENGAFYTPKEFMKYKGYYFKDIYILTENGLRFFIKKFDK